MRDESARYEFNPNALLGQPSNGIVLERYQKGSRIFVQGDSADSIGFLRAGTAKATTLSAVGKEAIVAILRPGQFFGEACLRGSTLRTSTVVALEDCQVTLITRQRMLALLHDEPSFLDFFLAYLLSRNDRLEGDLINQLLHSAEQRLARVLLLLAGFAQEDDQPITVSLSQESLAEMVGTTRSRVSTFMNRFREKGFISYDSRGRLQVYTALLLSVLAG